MTALAPTLEAYFTDRLAQRQASPHTVASYRDTFCLLLRFTQRQLGRAPSMLDFADLDAPLVGAFLDHLEHDRGNSLATRNNRLAAIHSLFHYAALRCPEHAALIARVLAIPAKRLDSRLVCFLTPPEVDTLLAAPDQNNVLGRRDHALLLTAVQTGLRVTELTGLNCADAELGPGANVRCVGKGRKERRIPLTRPTARLLRNWLHERHAAPADPLFPSRVGGRLSSDAVADLLAKHVATAARLCPSLTSKIVSPHTLRHTCAMNLLHSGVDLATIALWLGHATTKATDVYLHADLALKEQALARTAPQTVGRRRYQPADAVLAFLEAL
ncbi:MAG: tyrosine-type recombinase/integrase [Dermatophilaceae bacterium]